MDSLQALQAIHLQGGTFPAALSALAEAVKYRRESWQTWSNYALAAARTGAWAQALRGAQQVRPRLSSRRAMLTCQHHIECNHLSG